MVRKLWVPFLGSDSSEAMDKVAAPTKSSDTKCWVLIFMMDKLEAKGSFSLPCNARLEFGSLLPMLFPGSSSLPFPTLNPWNKKDESTRILQEHNPLNCCRWPGNHNPPCQ
jgi:hypothetical protein